MTIDPDRDSTDDEDDHESMEKKLKKKFGVPLEGSLGVSKVPNEMKADQYSSGFISSEESSLDDGGMSFEKNGKFGDQESQIVELITMKQIDQEHGNKLVDP